MNVTNVDKHQKICPRDKIIAQTMIANIHVRQTMHCNAGRCTFPPVPVAIALLTFDESDVETAIQLSLNKQRLVSGKALFHW